MSNDPALEVEKSRFLILVMQEMNVPKVGIHRQKTNGMVWFIFGSRDLEGICGHSYCGGWRSGPTIGQKCRFPYGLIGWWSHGWWCSINTDSFLDPNSCRMILEPFDLTFRMYAS